MKIAVPSIAIIMLLSQVAAAQTNVDMTPGMFGSRRVGLPLMQRSTGMAGGLQLAWDGRIAGRPTFTGAFATPWQYVAPRTVVIPGPIQPFSTTLAPATPYDTANMVSPDAGLTLPMMPQEMPQDMAPSPEIPVPTPDAASAPNVAVPLEGAAAPTATQTPMAPATPPAVSTVTAPQASARTALRLPYLSSYDRSPSVSDRLTRIARDRGMLAGPSIDVYFSGGVAVLQGTVRTARDRDLLANVAGLEPGVRQVYNGLATAASANASSQGGMAPR